MTQTDKDQRDEFTGETTSAGTVNLSSPRAIFAGRLRDAPGRVSNELRLMRLRRTVHTTSS